MQNAWLQHFDFDLDDKFMFHVHVKMAICFACRSTNPLFERLHSRVLPKFGHLLLPGVPTTFVKPELESTTTGTIDKHTMSEVSCWKFFRAHFFFACCAF